MMLLVVTQEIIRLLSTLIFHIINFILMSLQ
nr:MAG TPA: hypothetical protein [Caudoviricetes sp.]